MTAALLGKKIGMTRVYDESGAIVPVTVVQAGPCAVTQVKTVQTDGYDAIQLGYGEIKPKHSTQGLIGHAARAGVSPRRHFHEVRLKAAAQAELGATLKADIFNEVKFVDVTGTSKGKGTQGVMKRHGYKGQPATHGVERKHRSPGSIASHATWRGQSGKPKKGLRMGGRMGNEQVTARKHPLVKVDVENNLLLIKGSLPGPNGGILFVKQS